MNKDKLQVIMKNGKVSTIRINDTSLNFLEVHSTLGLLGFELQVKKRKEKISMAKAKKAVAKKKTAKKGKK